MSKDRLISDFDMDTKKCKTCMLTKITKKPFQIVEHETEVLELIHSYLGDLQATLSVWNKKYFVIFIDDASRTVRGVVPEHVTEEVVTQQPEPELIKGKRNRTPKNFGPKFQLYLIEGTRDEVSDQHSYCFNVEDDPKTFDKAMNKFDETGKGVIICLYVDDMLIFGTYQVQVDLAKEFFSLRFYMKDIREANVIIAIRIKSKSNGTTISQSHYIEKVLKKFNYFDCTSLSTLIDTSEKLMPNNGQAVSQLEYSMDWLIDISNTEDNSSTSGYVFLLGGAAGKEAEWLRNLILKIPLWSKPIAPISIRYDCANTLAKAYSQIYNGKSRHLGVRHSMIHELITNGVVSLKCVRSQ
ncbi:zinc finger, CCHC-type containing protein [Tanacetum coccineum]